MHDRHGTPLAVGDKVVIEGTIDECYDPSPEQEYCQIRVVTDVPMAGNAFNLSLNAKQVTKVGTVIPFSDVPDSADESAPTESEASEEVV